MPAFGALLTPLIFSRLTKPSWLIEIIPKISAHARQYSRFRENLVGELSSMSLRVGPWRNAQTRYSALTSRILDRYCLAAAAPCFRRRLGIIDEGDARCRLHKDGFVIQPFGIGGRAQHLNKASMDQHARA
jgi:hypothetical protein